MYMIEPLSAAVGILALLIIFLLFSFMEEKLMKLRPLFFALSAGFFTFCGGFFWGVNFGKYHALDTMRHVVCQTNEDVESFDMHEIPTPKSDQPTLPPTGGDPLL
jgi:hypothetical protein